MKGREDDYLYTAEVTGVTSHLSEAAEEGGDRFHKSEKSMITKAVKALLTHLVNSSPGNSGTNQQ